MCPGGELELFVVLIVVFLFVVVAVVCGPRGFRRLQVIDRVMAVMMMMLVAAAIAVAVTAAVHSTTPLVPLGLRIRH